MDKPAKSWCYTLNNYTEEEKDRLSHLECNYHVCGDEVGETGTHHLQGYIVFRQSHRLSALKKIQPRAHWERPKADENAANYCMKEKILWVKDNRRPRASKRSRSGDRHHERIWCTNCCFRTFECLCEIWPGT